MRLFNQGESLFSDKFLRQDKDGGWYEVDNEYVTERLLKIFDKYEVLERKYKKLKKKMNSARKTITSSPSRQSNNTNE